MCDKYAIKMREVGGGGFALHSQIAITQVVIRGCLQLVGSHIEEPATDHNQSAD